MKFKKIILMLTVLTCVLAVAGLGFATNRVEVKVTSEPMPEGSACDKAGGFSLAFDAGTVLQDSDVITIDLDYASSSKYTALCTTINEEISANGSSGLWNNTTVANASRLQTGPVYMRYVGTGAPTPTVSDVGGGVYFRLSGVVGKQRITLTVHGGSLTVGPDTELVINFLDQKTNAVDFLTNPGIYTPNASSVYNVAATRSANTLCVNITQWANESKVKASMDSKDDKFTFIPSDPQIAHIVTPVSYAAVVCKTAKCGSIDMPTATTQGSNCRFDNESRTGYCPGTHDDNYIVFNGAFDTAEQFYITATIKVNGNTGDNGVYFTPEGISAVSSASDIRCSVPAMTAVGGSYAYYLANNTATSPSGGTSCTVAAADKAVKMVTPAASMVAPGSTYLAIDLPAFTYNGSVVKEGDKVEVDIVLSKTPCGTVATATHCIGTFGCATVTSAQTLVFPYFTQMDTDADAYWDGFVITNLSATAGTAKLTVYEMDGDVATTSVSVGGNGIYVSLLSAMLDGMTLTKSVEGTLGNSRAYIVVCTDFTSDGFAMMGEASGTSMGYLPRNNQNVTSLCK